jgi:MFS family permease
VTPTPLSAVLAASRRLLRRPAFAALLFVSFAIFVMRGGARITLIPLYGGEKLGLSESQVGIVLGVSALVNVMVVNPGGWLVDRVGRRPVLIVGLLLTAAATGAYGLLDTYGALVMLSVAFGTVAALSGIPPPTLAGDLAPREATGAAVGLYRMAGDLGMVVGPLLMGAVTEGGAFLAGFGLAAGLLVLAAVATVLFIPETGGRRQFEAEESSGSP